jgi:hypothetical protein
MSMIDPILNELLREGETTKKVLARVPDDRLDWKPHAKSRSLGDLAWHVAALPSRIAEMAQHDIHPDICHPRGGCPPSSCPQLRANPWDR